MVLNGRWQFTTKPIGTNDIKDVEKVIKITNDDTLCKFHSLILDLDAKKDKKLSIEELTTYLPRLGEVQKTYRYFPDAVSLAHLFVRQTHEHAEAKDVQFEKGSVCERFFITSASQASLKNYIVKLLDAKKIEEAKAFTKACLYRFTITERSPGPYSAFSHDRTYIEPEFKLWLQERGLL